MDPIGGDVAAKITASIRDKGELLVYSSMTGMTSNVGIPDLLYRGVKVGGCIEQQPFGFHHDVCTAGLVAPPFELG